MTILELLQSAYDGRWFKSATELVRLAIHEIERLEKELADLDGLYDGLMEENKSLLADAATIERLQEKVRISDDKAMSQKARADHLQRELTQRKRCPDPGYYGDGREWNAEQQTQGEGK